MALIKCNECGREVSDKAQSCPSCGAPIENNMTQSQLFSLIFDNYRNLLLKFNEEELALIQEAKDTAPNTFKKKLKRIMTKMAS